MINGMNYRNSCHGSYCCCCGERWLRNILWCMDMVKQS